MVASMMWLNGTDRGESEVLHGFGLNMMQGRYFGDGHGDETLRILCSGW